VAAAEALLDRALGRPVPQLPEADHRPRITRIETVIIDPARDRDATLGGELEGAEGADLLRLPPLCPIAHKED